MNALLKRLDEASNDGDINKLKQLLEEDPLLLDRVLTEVRDNPLHIAALHGHVEFTSEVLRLKPELATKLNREGRSPLHLAAARGHLQVAEILVDKVGNDICLIRESNLGYMPVHIATTNGKHEVIKMLVERCKETQEKATNKMETLLHLAVMANCLDSIRYLIDQGINLNKKDENGNTCLHLAVAKSNHQVITYLLEQEGIEINSTNAMGLTPLDVLLVSSLCSSVDISLINTLRRARAMESTELGDLESNMKNSVVAGISTPSNWRLSKGNQNRAREKQSDAQTLLIVATLVATMTFQAISNPPGGFIQLPFEKSDASNQTWYGNWKNQTFPAGRPVLLWQLNSFFILDSLALFSSISVILWLLIAVPKKKIVMKFLVVVVWFAAFCAALAFGSAFFAIYVPIYGVRPEYIFINFKDYLGRVKWVLSLLLASFFVFVIAGLWETVIVIRFLWRKIGFKIKLPNWIPRVHWPKGSKWLTRIICFVSMVCVLFVFYYAISVIYSLIGFALKDQLNA